MKSLLFVLGFFISAVTWAEPLTLALNWKAEPEFGGFYAASLKNLYKKNGLEVQIIEGGSGTPTVQMLANGKVDFAIVSADEIILSHERNPKNRVKALLAIYQKSPYIIMTHAERNFKNIKEVLGSDGILAMQSGLPYYQYLVQKYGKPKAKVVPYAGGIGAFLADKNYSQQGFLTTEPLSATKKGEKVKNFLIADEGFNPYLVVLATTEETLAKRPDVVRKMIESSRAGWIDYLQNPLATNQYMATLNKSLDLETFQLSAEAQKPLIENNGTPLGQMTSQRWSELIFQMKSLKLIQSVIKAEDLYLKN